jgi:hypothetical protein
LQDRTSKSTLPIFRRGTEGNRFDPGEASEVEWDPRGMTYMELVTTQAMYADVTIKDAESMLEDMVLEAAEAYAF